LSKLNFSEISTFILEPVTGGRVLYPSKKLVNYLVSEVKKQGGLIISNEVTTGLGRTGSWFGFNNYNIEPDIVTLGKSLGNGYPISGVVLNAKVATLVEEKKFMYVQSHQNDPLGCVIANEVIQIMKEDNIISRSKKLGIFFVNALQELKNNFPIIKEVRGQGLMLAIELIPNYSSDLIANKMLEKGFFIGNTSSSNTLRFFPPLTTSEETILKMCRALEESLSELSTEII